MSLDCPVDSKNAVFEAASASGPGADLARLREAYLDLEATRPLRELGRTTAFINHEIKNYMMVISGYASLLQRSKNLSEKDRGMIDNIAQTAARLQEFNVSVLEMSKSSSGMAIEEFDLAEALSACVNDRFAADVGKFSIECGAPGGALLVNGNREKLIKAFSCAFENSLEAGARSVRVRVSVCNYVAMVIIDDNGKGCDADGFSGMSKTFYTTKPSANGMGLGLCVMRSIIEAHGGNVNLYSKNLLGGEKRGLLAVVTMPASKRNPSSAPVKAETFIVRDGLGCADGILRILKNIKTIPRMAASVRETYSAGGGESLRRIVFAAVKQADELRESGNCGPSVRILSIEEGPGCTLFASDGEGRELLTEEFAANCLAAQ